MIGTMHSRVTKGLNEHISSFSLILHTWFTDGFHIGNGWTLHVPTSTC